MKVPLKITRARSGEDITVIREIAYKTWPSAFASILSPVQIEYMLEWMYAEESLYDQIHKRENVFLIASSEKPLGFASYELNYKETKSAKLHKIYILPEAQGKGVGAALIKEVVAVCQKNNQKSLLLNVNRENKAVAVYQHLGFEIIGEEDIDIGNGFFMNDFVMELKFN